MAGKKAQSKTVSKKGKTGSSNQADGPSNPAQTRILLSAAVVLVAVVLAFLSLNRQPPSSSTQAAPGRRSGPFSNITKTCVLYENGGDTEIFGELNVTDETLQRLGLVYNKFGEPVESVEEFEAMEPLYWGPTKPGTHFMWPGVKVGHKVPVRDVQSPNPNGKQIELETLSTGQGETPRVFYIHNFMSESETDQLISHATNPENPYKMAPSTAGTMKAWNQGGSQDIVSTRTSMNAFDIETENAMNIKRRAFKLLRLPEYHEPMADGIQILRYELGQAYVAHHDYSQ